MRDDGDDRLLVNGSWSNFGSRFTVHGSRLLVVKD